MTMKLWHPNMDTLSTRRVLHDLTIIRMRFHSHPLYRRWSHSAYDSRLAYWAEEIPDQVSRILPTFFFVSPFLAMLVGILFGLDTLETVFEIVSIIFLILMLIVAAMGPVLAAGIAAGALAHERVAGRWDILMLIPNDRMSVVLMRISTMLFPYRPLVATLDILQTLSAILLVMVLNTQSLRGDASTLGACFLFFVPSLFLLTWERRQDYAFSVVMGSYSGIVQQPDKALGWALGGSVLMLGIRGLVGMLAVGLSPTTNGLSAALPAFVAGPGVLPMLGVHLDVTLVLLVLYYGAREIAITLLWRKSVERVEDIVG
jgi:hypothetical protein